MLNEINSLHEYVLGWLYAREYTVEEHCIVLILETDDEYEHWYRIIEDEYVDDYILDRDEPCLITSFLTTTTDIPSKMYIYDKTVINNLINMDSYNTKCFKRGYFDAIGTIQLENYITCYIPCLDDKTNKLFKKEIDKYTGKYDSDNNEIMWEENDALNFICDLYDVVDKNMPNNNYYYLNYLDMIDNAKQIHLDEIPKFIYYKLTKNAVGPFKEFTTHPGFGISVCEKIDEKDGIHYYTTGLKFSCEYGYYLEIYGEQLYKIGYMLANPFDIIKPGEDSELIIPLIKLNPSVKDLELPYHVVNVIPKKLNIVEFYELP